MTFNWKKIKKIHFIGAGGIGVSAVVKLALREGKTVTASDIAESEITVELQKRGVSLFVGHQAKNIAPDTSLVIYSSAVPENNVERMEARRLGIAQLSYFEFLGEYSRDKFTIAVSGTNGKSTTTALLGLILEAAGFDPTVIVGSKVFSFPDGNLRCGKSKYFVVEGCEHMANMLKLHPRVIVLTNIEEDHLDFYRDLAHIRLTFQQYIERLPKNGKLILNADDRVSFFELEPRTPTVTYGLSNSADYLAKNIAVHSGEQKFDILKTGGREHLLPGFKLRIPGKFNIYNALAAAACALELGVSEEVIKKMLADFGGIWRRFEIVGRRDGALVVSDYGHHPSAIRGTLEAAREFYPGRRIVLVFEPHQRHRTKSLFKEFVVSFDNADILILSEIYDVAGREKARDSDVNSAKLAGAVLARDKSRGLSREVFYAKDLNEARVLVTRLLKPGDLVICMGAGNINLLARSLVLKSK